MVIDFLERIYIMGFPLLQVFVTLFPLLARWRTAAGSSEHADREETRASPLEFLPLMLTSVYCAVGLVWAFIRLSVIYLARKD